MKKFLLNVVLFILGIGTLIIGAFFSIFIVGIALVFLIGFGIYWRYKIKKLQQEFETNFENINTENWQPIIQAEFKDLKEESQAQTPSDS